MEKDVPKPTLPDLDESDVMALEAILVRTVRAQDASARDREQLKIISERIAANTKITNGAYEALSVIYGFAEPDDPDVNRWDLVREAIGAERYARAVAVARGTATPPLLTGMGHQGPETKAEQPTVEKQTVPIKTAILEFLRAAGDRGVKVAEVKKHLVAAHGISVHEKTPGMTLYRLMKDGLARREGRTWYALQDDKDEIEWMMKTGADLA